MSEPLPDVYLIKTDANRTGYDYVGTDYRVSTEQIQYTPHSKLQEAEKVLVGALEAIETILAHLDDPLTIKIFANAAIRIIKEHH